MGDLVTLGVGALTALAALGGSIGGHFLQARTERLHHERAMRVQNREARRTAYTALFSEILTLLMAADGGSPDGRSVAETRMALLQRVAEARLHAAPETWGEMQPLLTFAEARYTMATGHADDAKVAEAAETLESLGGDGAEQAGRFQERFLAAALAEVGPPSEWLLHDSRAAQETLGHDRLTR